jgi:hypothetical protein
MFSEFLRISFHGFGARESIILRMRRFGFSADNSHRAYVIVVIVPYTRFSITLRINLALRSSLAGQGLEGVLFGLLDVFPHDALTKLRILQFQGHQDFLVTLHSPSAPVGISKGILAVSQYILSHVHDQAMKPGFVRYEFMEGIMKPRIPLENLTNLFSS